MYHFSFFHLSLLADIGLNLSYALIPANSHLEQVLLKPSGGSNRL